MEEDVAMMGVEEEVMMGVDEEAEGLEITAEEDVTMMEVIPSRKMTAVEARVVRMDLY